MVGIVDNRYFVVPMTKNREKNSILTRFLQAVLTNIRAISFLNTHRLWRFAIFPGIISAVILFGLAFFLFAVSYEHLQEWMYQFPDKGGIVGWLFRGTKIIVKIVLFLFVFVICLFFYRSLTLIFVMPFLGVLLNKMEFILLGKPKNITLKQDLTNLLFGIWLSFKLFFLEILFFFIALPLGPLQPLVVLFISSYVFGRGIAELVLERNYPNIKDRKRWAASHFPEIAGLGTTYYLLLCIPVLGPMVAPATTLTGAALIYYKK